MNKIALVTGGSRGLGKDMALSLARKGIDVVVTWNTKEDEALQVADEIKAMGRKSAALHLDVSATMILDDFVVLFSHMLNEEFNSDKFDFLVNNAGIGATIPFNEVTEEDFDRMLNTHFKGAYFLTQKLLPFMNDHGGIVNISTGTTRFCVPGYSAYASMKGAMEVLTRYLAKELGPRGIRANIVAPGPIVTDFNNAMYKNNPERREMLSKQTALGRVGNPDDIGSVVAFLCSDDSKWVNAQRIEVTGGLNL